MFGAVDVGGTKTLVGIFDGKGNLLKEERFRTPLLYKDFRVELANIVDKLSTKDLLFTTVALPGRLDRVHGIGITFGNLPWKKVSVRDHAEKIFHSPVIIENDAKLASLYQAKLLKDNYKKVLYITISTGIGVGLCINGQIDHDLQDMEAGSMMFEHNGKIQRWENFASGKAIKNQFNKKAADITETKDWEIISKNIAIGVIDLIATLTPDVVVFGGGVGAHLEKFQTQLNQHLKKYANNMVVVPPLIKAQKPEESVLYGCYYYGKDKYEAVSH